MNFDKIKFDETKFNRLDTIFSYWILLFTIIYFLGYISYNPLFLLIIALTFNIFQFILLCYIAPFKYAIVFFIVNFFIKVVPIYLLRDTTITMKDIYFSFFLIFIYVVYLCILYFIFQQKYVFDALYTKNQKPGFLSYHVIKILNL